MLAWLEWIGAAGGAIGALLLACNNKRWSGYGFVVFLVANAAWMAYGVKTGTYGLVMMQTVCTGTSLLGIWRWLVLPRLERREAPKPVAIAEEPIPDMMVYNRLLGARKRFGTELPRTQ